MIRDKDIREPLFEFLEETYGRVRIIEEKAMGKSRADVVMITENALFAIEIKSDADTYARLASQVKDYDRYYDYNVVVVGTSHALHIREHVPAYWGVITVENVNDALDFYVFRKPEPNPHVTLKKKLEILWRPELFEIQQKHGMPKYKEKKRQFVIDKISEWTAAGKIDSKVLSTEVCEILFERDYTTVTDQLQEYRKGEIRKQLETERDPEQQIQLMMKQESAKINLRLGKRTGRKKKKR